MRGSEKKIFMKRKDKWEVEYVGMAGRMERELTLPWLVSLEATALLLDADDTWGNKPTLGQ